MSWTQKQFTLPPRSRGSYLITNHVVSELPELRSYKVGLLTLFVQHTSCALSLNENCDDDVRADMSDALDRIAPEDHKGNLYRHDAEGLDDMPVRFPPPLDLGWFWYNGMVLIGCVGTHQVVAGWCFGDNPDYQRTVEHRYLAGDLLHGVPGESALAQGCCDNSG